MIDFRAVVSPGEFVEWWPRVREGLIDNVRFHGEHTAPERVYQAIVSGAAELFLIFDAEEYLGFAVTTAQGVGDRLHPYLYLWQVWAPGLFTGDRFAQYMGWLDRLAAERGLGAVRIDTTRPGWGRALQGWAEPVTTTYERKVPHG